MKKNLTCILLIIMLLIGGITDIFLLGGRVDAEMDDRDVAAAVYWKDIRQFYADENMDEEAWLRHFSENGVRYVVFSETAEAEALELLPKYDLAAAAVGNLDGEWDLVIPIKDEELRDIGDTPLAMMKNAYRTSTITPLGFDIESYEGPMIKAVYMYAGYSNRYKDDIRGEEIENVLFRAITDRGARLLLLRPITYKDLTIVTDPEVYSEVLQHVAQRIEERGYNFGESCSILRTEVMSPLTLWLTGFIPVAVWIFLATRFKPFKRFGIWLIPVGLIGTGVCCVLIPDLAQKVLALACTLGFTLSWVWILYNYFMLEKGPRFRALPAYLLGVLAVILWGFLGGLSVAAIQTDLAYLMGETIFSGVKLSMTLPLVVCGCVFAMPIFRRVIARDYSKKEILGMLPAAVIILVAMAVLIRRSGDTGGEISELENRLRVAFEYAYYARPRTKEILVAVPFMSLIFLPHLRRDSMLRLIGALCCSLECTSIINTFCHGLAPLHVSLIRGSMAAASGAVLGIIIIAALSLIHKYKAKLLPETQPKGGDGA